MLPHARLVKWCPPAVYVRRVFFFQHGHSDGRFGSSCHPLAPLPAEESGRKRSEQDRDQGMLRCSFFCGRLSSLAEPDVYCSRTLQKVKEELGSESLDCTSQASGAVPTSPTSTDRRNELSGLRAFGWPQKPSILDRNKLKAD